MYCRKCGIKLEDNSTFCPDCGEKVSGEEITVSTRKTNKPTSDKNSSSSPFREEFFRHIKGVSFFMTVLFASVYYTVDVLNSIRHFSSSDILISVTAILYGLIALGLVVPSLWMIYLDRSPHSAFVPIKLYGFINLTRLFLFIAFGILTVTGAIMGKDEITRSVLYLADRDVSVYILTLLLQTAKNPSLMLVTTSGVICTTYLIVSLMYHISLIRLLNSVSKRINDNDTYVAGYGIISSISFFVSAISFIYALSMYLFLKDDIYNVLFAVFKGIFHLMVFLDMRNLGNSFQGNAEEETDEES